MTCIRVLVDEDFGLETIKLTSPRMRTGARGIVIREDGKIALLNKVNKNEYKLPGGGLEGNETIEEAFKREVLEETGCEVEIIEELGTIEEDKTHGNFIQISHMMVSKVIKDTNNLNLTDKEREEGGRVVWVDENEALELIVDCYDKLKESKYEDLYYTRFMIKRDRYILEYYLNNKE